MSAITVCTTNETTHNTVVRFLLESEVKTAVAKTVPAEFVLSGAAAVSECSLGSMLCCVTVLVVLVLLLIP